MAIKQYSLKKDGAAQLSPAVSYTHLTLPTTFVV